MLLVHTRSLCFQEEEPETLGDVTGNKGKKLLLGVSRGGGSW
jgi:hypothetical protein